MPGFGIGNGSGPTTFGLALKRAAYRNIGTLNKALDWCLDNPPCYCDGTQISPSTPPGPDVVGTSGTHYRLRAEFGKLLLPRGAKLLGIRCVTQPACCPVPGMHATPCCPFGLPDSLTLTIAGAGSGSCLTGTYTLTYNSGNNDWEWSGTTCSGATVKLTFYCDSAQFFLRINRNMRSGCNDLFVDMGSTRCALFSGLLNWTGANGDCFANAGEASGTVTATINVTDGLVLKVTYADLWIPRAPKLLAEGCEHDPDCAELGCRSVSDEVSACGCPNPQPRIIYAAIDMPSCPALDGLFFPLFFSAGAWCALTVNTNDERFCLAPCLSCPFGGAPGVASFLGPVWHKVTPEPGGPAECIGDFAFRCALMSAGVTLDCQRPFFASGTLTVNRDCPDGNVDPCKSLPCGNCGDSLTGTIYFSE
jgi:hypothetical protein